MRVPVLLSVVGLSSACMMGHGFTPQPSTPAAQRDAQSSAGAGGEGMAQMCPMSVSGTQVAAVDTADGVALVFTNSRDSEGVRRRVHAMADMHNEHHAGGGHAGMMGGGMMGHGAMMEHGGAQGSMPPTARATAEDVEMGARIVLTPVNATDRDSLRTHVQEHAAEMQRTGTCPMAMAAPDGTEGQQHQH